LPDFERSNLHSNDTGFAATDFADFLQIIFPLIYRDVVCSTFDLSNNTNTKNMTTGIRIKMNGIKGLMLPIIFTVLSINSCMVKAQSTREMLDLTLLKSAQVKLDSINKLYPRKQLSFRGYELSTAFASSRLTSNISQLDGLRAELIGGHVAGMLGNHLGKVKAGVGMYYSTAATPYTINALQGGLSGSLYFLRLKEMTQHSFEPYALIGVNYLQTKFYGSYLNHDAARNYSTIDEPLLATVNIMQLTLGSGVEFQLESDDQKFMHFFIEGGYGLPLVATTSNAVFSGTTIKHSMNLKIGVSFGIAK
jgi:hypothetical protein